MTLRRSLLAILALAAAVFALVVLAPASPAWLEPGGSADDRPGQPVERPVTVAAGGPAAPGVAHR